MKRILPLLLAVILLLAGCGSANLDENVEKAQVTKSKDSGVTAFDLTDRTCAKILAFGEEDYALFTTNGQLLVMDGTKWKLTASKDLGCEFAVMDQSIAALDDRLGYYDSQRGAYVILDSDLTEVSAVAVPEDLTVGPAISADLTTLYYGTETGIRALDLETGISRLVRQEYAQITALDGLLFEDSVLHYTRLVDEEPESCFIFTETGTLTDSDQSADIRRMVSWDNSYAALTQISLPFESLERIQYGTLGSEPEMVAYDGAFEELLLLDGGMLLVQTATENGLNVELYDLDSQEMLARGELDGVNQPFTYAQVENGTPWLWNEESFVLYRWDYTGSAAEEKTLPVLTEQIVTEEDVEAARLEVEERYGVPVRITQDYGEWEQVGFDYDSHRPSQYQAAVELLDNAMSRLPEGFFDEMQDSLVIELVDEFNPNVGVPDATGYFSLGKEMTIQVTMTQELQATFYHELYHAMEWVLSSSKLSKWESLNPEGFSYEDFETYTSGELEDSEYVGTVVASPYGMTSANEDRAQIFMYAMLEGEEARFQSETMQSKLAFLSEAIREAFDWEDSQEVFPWEQYLGAVPVPAQ